MIATRHLESTSAIQWARARCRQIDVMTLLDKIAEKKRTSCCRIGLLNLGSSAWVPSLDATGGIKEERDSVLLAARSGATQVPAITATSHDGAVVHGCASAGFALAVAPDDGRRNGDATHGEICDTCINWIGHAYGCEAPPSYPSGAFSTATGSAAMRMFLGC